MPEEAIDAFETPLACEQTTEYQNPTEDQFEIEPEEEHEDPRAGQRWEEIESQFARYERNYRARRIRELTRSTLRRKGGKHSKRVTA